MAAGGGQPPGPGQELVLEVFSNSTKAWMVGIVCSCGDGGLVTVRFLDGAGQKRQKAAYRQDPMFAQFGKHCVDKLPPGCVKVPSSTRPGQFSYFDQAVNRKFATPELAWHAFLEQKLIVEAEDAQRNGPPPPSPTPVNVAQAGSPAPVNTLLAPAARAAPEGPPMAASPYPAAAPPAPAPISAATIAAPAAAPAASAAAPADLAQWVNAYVHQPVLATPGINYLNQVPINFDRCTELFAQEAAANAPYRARLIPSIESGAFMRSCCEVFRRCDPQHKNFLMNNGEIRNYVVGVFQHCGLVEPKEMQISKMSSAFDANKQNWLGVTECLLLADAIARTVFRSDPSQPSASSAAAPQKAVHGGQPLGTQAAASPFLALLAGLGRQDGHAQETHVPPHVYSNLVNHGQHMPATEVTGFGLVDGATSLARILCQRAPTSVLSGGPHAEQVRVRLQAKAADMVRAQQAMMAAHVGMGGPPPQQHQHQAQPFGLTTL